MTARSKVVLGSIAGAVAIHLVFLACGTPTSLRGDGGHDSSSVLDAMSETMGDVVDHETGTADAQSMPASGVEIQCDQVQTRQTTTPTSSTVITTYYAELATPRASLARPPKVQMWLCDSEALSTPPVACPAGSTCNNSGYQVPSPSCTWGAPIVASGRIVVTCGSRVQVTIQGMPNGDSGSRARRAIVHID